MKYGTLRLICDNSQFLEFLVIRGHKGARFDVDKTLFGRQQRCYNAETTPCAYLESVSRASVNIVQIHSLRFHKKSFDNGTFSSTKRTPTKRTVVRSVSDPTNNMAAHQENNQPEFKLDYQRQLSDTKTAESPEDVVTKISNKRMRRKQSRWTLIITFLSFVLIIIMITIAYLVSKGFLKKDPETV